MRWFLVVCVCVWECEEKRGGTSPYLHIYIHTHTHTYTDIPSRQHEGHCREHCVFRCPRFWPLKARHGFNEAEESHGYPLAPIDTPSHEGEREAVCVCMCVYNVDGYLCAILYIYTHIHTYIHTHTHTYIYTYKSTYPVENSVPKKGIFFKNASGKCPVFLNKSTTFGINLDDSKSAAKTTVTGAVRTRPPLAPSMAWVAILSRSWGSCRRMSR